MVRGSYFATIALNFTQNRTKDTTKNFLTSHLNLKNLTTTNLIDSMRSCRNCKTSQKLSEIISKFFQILPAFW